MKKAILLSGALLALTATVAAAAPGLNLGWQQCGVGGAANRNFNCAVNSGSGTLIASFVSGDTEGRAMAGNDVVLDLQSAGPVLPAWWAFKNVGTCRINAAATNQVFAEADNVDVDEDGPATQCLDIFHAAGGGGIAAYNIGYGGPNRARMIVAYGLAASAQSIPTPDMEYASFKLAISYQLTTTCAGCLDPVCIVLNEIKQTTPGGLFTVRIGSPAARNFVTWQGGQIQPPGCPLATPTRNATWGSVKALYR